MLDLLLKAELAQLAAPPQEPVPHSVNADQALRELLAGNQRFMIGRPLSPRRSPGEFRTLAHGQFLEAVIVSCVHSRVAPEILFDVGVGDINAKATTRGYWMVRLIWLRRTRTISGPRNKKLSSMAGVQWR